MDNFQLNYAALAVALAHAGLGVVVLICAKLIQQVFSPYSMDRELTTQDNPAFGLAITGYYGAVVTVFVGSAAAQDLPLDAGSRAVLTAMGLDLAWTLAGILALNGARWMMDRLLVSGSRNSREIIEQRNTAAGALEFGAYIASGFVLAGAIRQPGGGIWSAVALFVLGECALIIVGRLYQSWAGYDLAREIRNSNLAAGVAFGMTLIAIALLMLKAISGDFVSWGRNLSFFALDAIAGLILLLILRWLTDLVLLPNARIPEEIARDRNVNAGLIEGILAIGVAVIILFLF
jgi:uncharacterized membrane protein YjfL (UPF0719 family)